MPESRGTEFVVRAKVDADHAGDTVTRQPRTEQCCEQICELQYKLQMMGIPCGGPTYIYDDNQSVLANTTIPDSALKKKSKSIAYHFVREGSARDNWQTSYINTIESESDLLIKILYDGEKRKHFTQIDH
eukprot:9343359-Ditylum_brightwellii.AAC.1